VLHALRQRSPDSRSEPQSFESGEAMIGRLMERIRATFVPNKDRPQDTREDFANRSRQHDAAEFHT
jgi:hypothetical protein